MRQAMEPPDTIADYKMPIPVIVVVECIVRCAGQA